MQWFDMPRIAGSDAVAGASVAMVLIPQSLAYAELADLPPYIGLYAAAFPLLAFALFASSPYLQTGPVAVTSLLTLAALPDASPEQLPKLAALLAVLVGIFRFLLGVGRAGRVVRLMSSPVVMGFTSGAAIVIVSSQLPRALGIDPPEGGVLYRAAWSLTHPGRWELAAVVLSVITIALFRGPRPFFDKLPWLRLFPGVLIAVVIGIVYSTVVDYGGPIIDDVPQGLPPFGLDLPWDQTPSLLVGAVVIALVGFAEPASIARTFANEAGERWDPDRELFASGIANLVAAFSGAYPVGGSFSRSSINRLAGAQTRWSGGVTGLIVLAFLPFAAVLEPLPNAVLGAIVCGAAITLVKPRQLLGLWNRSKSQAALAWTTFAATLLFTPRLERAVVLGVTLTLTLHFVRRFTMRQSIDDEGTVTVAPTGMMWMGTEAAFTRGLRDAATTSDDRVLVDFRRTPFIDDTTADAMQTVANEMGEVGQHLDWTNEPAGSESLLGNIDLPDDDRPLASE